MDDLEPEQIEDPQDAMQQIKKKAAGRRHRSEVDCADLGDDEQNGLTIWLDKLPNHTQDILAEIERVKKFITDLEEKWLEMENSDDETVDAPEQLVTANSIDLVKGKSHLKQHYCIPCTANVRTYEFNILVKAQMLNGGRLFDVISMDPPWQLSSANPTRGVAIAYDTLSDVEILDRIPYHSL